MSNDSTVQSSGKTPKDPIITTVSGGDNKFFKIALIVLGIVLLIAVSEVGYFIFAKKGAFLFSFGKKAAKEEQARPLVGVTSPTSPPLLREKTKGITVSPEKARDFADQLDAFAIKNNLDLLGEASINFTISGVVTSAAFDKKEIAGVEYVYNLGIKGPKGGEVTYWLTDKEVVDAQVSLSSGTGTSKISITEIKAGDNISLKGIVNLLDASPHSSLILKVTR